MLASACREVQRPSIGVGSGRTEPAPTNLEDGEELAAYVTRVADPVVAEPHDQQTSAGQRGREVAEASAGPRVRQGGVQQGRRVVVQPADGVRRRQDPYELAVSDAPTARPTWLRRTCAQLRRIRR